MKREIQELEKARQRYEGKFNVLEKKIKEVCDFEAYLTWCTGDGHLVGNDETMSIAPLYCLEGKSKRNKLTAEEHKYFCI